MFLLSCNRASTAQTLAFLIASAFSAGCMNGHGTVDADSIWVERTRSLEQDIPAWMEEAGIPGMAIAVIGPDGDWVQQFGTADAGSGRSVTSNTVFEAASLSKPLFARLVLQDVADGVIEIDAPLSRYFDYADLRDDPWVDSITTRIVLTHQTGLPNWRRGAPLATEFQPGARFQYSGEGYVYLQHSLSEVVGEDLHERVFRNTLEPLDMMRSSYLFETTDPDFAVPHNTAGHVTDKSQFESPGNAAYSLHTTAGDYGRFLRSVLDEELLGSGDLSRTSESTVHVADGIAWGLGWGLEYVAGRDIPALWHWGDNGPFKAFTYLDPVLGRGVVYFTNSESGLMLTERILDRLFPGEHPLIEYLESMEYEQLD